MVKNIIRENNIFIYTLVVYVVYLELFFNRVYGGGFARADMDGFN
jgi:hypothetical protein